MKNQKSKATSPNQRSCDISEEFENIIKNVLCYSRIGFTLEEIVDFAKIRFDLTEDDLEEKINSTLQDMIKNGKIKSVSGEPTARFQLVKRPLSKAKTFQDRILERTKNASIENCSNRAKQAVYKYFEEKTRQPNKELLISPRSGNSIGNRSVSTFLFGSSKYLGFNQPCLNNTSYNSRTPKKQPNVFRVKKRCKLKQSISRKHPNSFAIRPKKFKQNIQTRPQQRAKISQKYSRKKIFKIVKNSRSRNQSKQRLKRLRSRSRSRSRTSCKHYAKTRNRNQYKRKHSKKHRNVSRHGKNSKQNSKKRPRQVASELVTSRLRPGRSRIKLRENKSGKRQIRNRSASGPTTKRDLTFFRNNIRKRDLRKFSS